MNTLEMLLQMAETESDNPYVQYMLGQEFARDRQLDHAVLSFQKALQLADTSFSSLIQRSIDEINQQKISSQEKPMLHVLKGGVYQEKLSDDLCFNYDQMIGFDQVKHVVNMRLKQADKYASLYKKFGYKPSGGLILYGPSGCGKSMFVEATANEFDMPIVQLSVQTVIDPFYGQSLANVESLFEEARSYSRSIVLIHDLDTFAYLRTKSSFELRNIIDQVIQEIDRCSREDSSVLIIGLTDMPWDIDPVVRRAGRLDQIFFVSPPSLEERQTLFNQMLQDKPMESDVQVLTLAEQTKLFSRADIQSVVSLATEKVIEQMIQGNIDDKKLSQQDLEKSIQQLYASTTDWLVNSANYVRFANQSGFYDDVKEYLQDNTTYLSE